MAYRIATIPGDGIGSEVVEQALRVLEATGVEAQPTYFNLGAARYNSTGEVLPDAELEDIRGYDAILLGAVGDPSVPPGVLERGLLLKLRFGLDHHVNLRPVKLYPGVATPLAGKVRGTSTWWCAGRAPKVRTLAPAVRCASGPLGRSRSRRV